MPFDTQNLFERASKIRAIYQKPRLSLEEMRLYAIEVEFSEEEWNEVIQIFERYWQKGDSYLKNNNWIDAIEELEKAYQLEPLHEGVLFDLALAYQKKWSKSRRKQDKEKAIFYAEHCLEANPRSKNAAKIITNLRNAPIKPWISPAQQKKIVRYTFYLILLGGVLLAYLRYKNDIGNWISQASKQFSATNSKKDNDFSSSSKVLTLEGVLFESGSVQLSMQSKIALDKFIQFLDENKDLKGEIAGHTDNTGDKISNLKVSEIRAKIVYDYLIQQGIDARRLSYKGYGDTNPAYDNDSELNRFKNRRIEFIRK